MPWSCPPPYYLFAIVVLACGGIPKGYDEGGFSASVKLTSFQKDFNLVSSHWVNDATGLTNRNANITSFGVLGAAFGALICYFTNDRIGRLRSYQIAIFIWAAGLFMQIFSSGIYGFLLFTRIFSGLGSGGLTVIAPLFLSEIAPSKSRGAVVSVYMVALLLALSVGFFINYGANKDMAATRTQYRLVQAIPLIPVGFALIASFFLDESPRWLASKGRMHASRAALARVRGKPLDDPTLIAEFEQISTDTTTLAELKSASMPEIIREVFTVPSLRSRFLLALTMQTVAQWTGGNGITYYISTIFEYAGVTGSSASLIDSGAYGLVKLFFTMIFTWGLIDFIGRRRCFAAGLIIQCVSHVYLALYFSVIPNNQNSSNAAIAAVFVYAVGWSIGLCTIPYIYGAELFPTRVRAFSYAANMGLHWFWQFAVVRVTPNMLTSLDKWGAYVFWASVCFVGLIVLWLWAAETKGVAMENMDELFDRPWYRCGSAKAASGDKLCPSRQSSDDTEAIQVDRKD